MDNLEAAPGRPAPEFQVKILKKVKLSYEFTSEWKIYQNNISLFSLSGGQLEFTWGPVEANPGVRPGTEVIQYAFMYV